MQVNIHEFIEQSNLGEAFYPGKRMVKTCPQPGEFRSHCIIYDWRDPSLLRIEIKAGLTGYDLPANDLVRYPVSFQSPTFIEIDVNSGRLKNASDGAQRLITKTESIHEDDESEDTTSSSGKSGGGGGKRPSKKLKTDHAQNISTQRSSFGSAVAGQLPDIGNIINVVVMGMKVAEDAYKNVIDKLSNQIKHAKIVTAELMIAAGKAVVKYTPPAFLKPKGDENKTYKYNREKNEPMFSGPT